MKEENMIFKVSFKLIYTFMAIFVLFSFLHAEEAKKDQGSQKVCPIQGKAIDKEVSVDFQGQRIYFCCPGCDTDFLKDPEKYFKEMKKRGEIVKSIQKECAVSGKKLGDKKVSLTLPGRKLLFCCKNCMKKFKKNKDKYLAKMSGKSDKHDHKKGEHKHHKE